MPQKLTKPFILILVVLVLAGCYLIFRPFLTEIIVAAVMASVFYTPFLRFSAFLKGRKNLAAILMCLLLLVIIILPAVKLMIYAGEKSVDAYGATVEFFNNHTVNDLFKTELFQRGALRYLNFDGFIHNESIKAAFLNTLKASSNWLLSGATFALKETTNFVISLFLIIIAMFFFFVDGKKMMIKLMYLSPLQNKYDQELFRKFRAISRTTFISTFVVAIAQGLVGAIGFAIVGFPAFLAGVLVALLSLIPYVGSMIFYVPVGIFYLLTGEIWQGIFVLLWGMLIIGTIDNVIRTYMISKDEAEINPVFVLFSILGGIVFFGFWGVIIGPLLVALAVTVLHIYELEFCEALDGENCRELRGEVSAAERAEKAASKKKIA